ncbi:hypothetical protein [Aequorivita capsosiphonis]|uniref:hypothetical protein n=1 Tax=Aequorivita capsosiphonis TaxID=487317 RepID=UPI0003F794C6|nr:hypothetical protein [Aequorivita capsosiphonis]
MSGGAGHIFSMIASLKNNKRNRKNLFDKNVHEQNEAYGKITDYKKMSPAQFEAFKQKLKENELRRQKNLTIVFGGIMIVIIGVLIYFLFFH